MADRIKLRRGPKSKLDLNAYELGYVTDSNEERLYFNNGAMVPIPNNKDITDIKNELTEAKNISMQNKKDVTELKESVAGIDNITSQLNANKEEKTTVQALYSRVNSLASGSPRAVNNISEMTDTLKNYVLTTDGNWYYYNGSAWVSGGVYQSTGIAEKSVNYSKLSDSAFENIKNISEYKNVDITIKNGLYQISDGTYRETFNDWRTTEKISCIPGEAYRITTYLTGPIVALALFYDANGNYLSYLEKGGDTGKQYTDYELFIPDGAFYFVVDGHINGSDIIIEKLMPVDIKNKLESLNLSTSEQSVELLETKNGYWNADNNQFIEHTKYKFNIYDVSLLNKVHLKCKYSLNTNLFVLFDNDNNVIDRKSYTESIIFNNNINVSNVCKIGVSVNIDDIETLELKATTASICNRLMQIENNPKSFWAGKKIVWLGTSIPAGGLTGYYNDNAYPQRIGKILGSTVYNEAIGSSTIHCKNPDLIDSTTNPYGFINDFHKVSRCLTNSIAEMNWVINNYNSSIFTANVPSSSPNGAVIRGYSYENKIKKYVGEDIDLWVIDHGFNDFGHSQYLSEDDYSKYDEYNLYTFRGAMNFVINEIKKINPHARIVMIGNYENQTRPEIAKYQDMIAENWDFPIYRQWLEYGWSKRKIKTTGYWELTDSTNSLYTWRESGGIEQEITNLNLWLGDGVHPHSDASGKTLQFIAEHISAWLNNNIRC